MEEGEGMTCYAGQDVGSVEKVFLGESHLYVGREVCTNGPSQRSSGEHALLYLGDKVGDGLSAGGNVLMEEKDVNYEKVEGKRVNGHFRFPQEDPDLSEFSDSIEDILDEECLLNQNRKYHQRRKAGPANCKTLLAPKFVQLAEKSKFYRSSKRRLLSSLVERGSRRESKP